MHPASKALYRSMEGLCWLLASYLPCRLWATKVLLHWMSVFCSFPVHVQAGGKDLVQRKFSSMTDHITLWVRVSNLIVGVKGALKRKSTRTNVYGSIIAKCTLILCSVSCDGSVGAARLIDHNSSTFRGRYIDQSDLQFESGSGIQKYDFRFRAPLIILKWSMCYILRVQTLGQCLHA